MNIPKAKLLSAGLLAGLSSIALAAPEDDGNTWVADSVERCVRGVLPSFENEVCTYPACAEGCTDVCKEKTAAYRKKLAADPTAYYAEIFNKKPHLWEAAAPIVERRFCEEKTTPEEQGRILDLVSSVPAAMESELPSNLWAITPDLFHVDHLISFATTGRKVFVKALAARVDETNASETPADIRPALFFALKGDPRGKPTLARAVKRTDLATGDVLSVLLAAKGLEALGYQDCLTAQHERVFEATVAALDAGDLARAREMAVQAEIFAETGKKAYKGWGWRAAYECAAESCGSCAERTRALADADSVLQAIERVTPL